MDSVTHVVLGAALGEVTLGKKVGYKAAVVGAAANTFPDLDVFLNFFTDDEVLKLQIHRSYTHALPVQILFAFPLAWLTHVLFKKRVPFWEWYLLWVICLSTHALLDSCTTYGTQLLLPFTNMLVGFNNISVIDIFFTVPFLAFVVVALVMKKDNPSRIRTAWMGLSYAMLYMVFTVVNKSNVQQHFEKELTRQEIRVEKVYASPAFFSNFLWAGIATTGDSVWLGEYSVFQKRESVKWVSFPRNTELVKNHPDKRSTQVLEWFAQGKYFSLQKGDTLKFFNVKWGRSDFRESQPERAIIFNYLIVPDKQGWKTSVRQPRMSGDELKTAFASLWKRMFGMGEY